MILDIVQQLYWLFQVATLLSLPTNLIVPRVLTETPSNPNLKWHRYLGLGYCILVELSTRLWGHSRIMELPFFTISKILFSFVLDLCLPRRIYKFWLQSLSLVDGVHCGILLKFLYPAKSSRHSPHVGICSHGCR